MSVVTRGYGEVVLKAGREKKLRGFYPWVQKGEVARAEAAGDGGLVRVLDGEGGFVGVGTYVSGSRFPVRVLSLVDEAIDGGWFRGRFARAVGARARVRERTEVWRAVYSEGDEVAGLIVDVVGGVGVVQVRGLGMERLRGVWEEPLAEVLGGVGVRGGYEKSDMAGRAEEGLSDRVGVLWGEVGDEVEVVEEGVRYLVPVKAGLKTGHYCDQRDSRVRLGSLVRAGEKVLDCFCYTGGFLMHGLRAGGVGFGVDLAEVAVEGARRNLRLNGLEAPVVQANVFEYLESGAAAFGPYDWIVLDPPAIAKTREKRDSLKWAVWKLVYGALPLLRPGGSLVVCTCTYQLSIQETAEACRLAAGDRGCRLALDAVTLQGEDHPAVVSFPEGLYLKCLWLRKV